MAQNICITRPPVPFTKRLAILSLDTIVQITGITLPGFNRIVMNFQADPETNANADIAMRVEFGLQGVKLNSLISSDWGSAEQFSDTSLAAEKTFEIMILCDRHRFKIAINGKHFVSFVYRLPLSCVNSVTIDGEVDVLSFRIQLPESPPLPEASADVSAATVSRSSFLDRMKTQFTRVLKLGRNRQRADSSCDANSSASAAGSSGKQNEVPRLIYPELEFPASAKLLVDIHRFVKASHSRSEMTVDELLLWINDSPATPLLKVQLTEKFSAERFILCVVTNLLLTQKDQQLPLVIADLRQLYDVLLSFYERSIRRPDESTQLSLEFALTVCVHTSKTVESASWKKHTSHITWFFKEIVLEYFYAEQVGLNLPEAVDVPEEFEQMWHETKLKENLVAFFDSLRLDAPNWDQPNIRSALNKIKFRFFCGSNVALGFVMLDGIAINFDLHPKIVSLTPNHRLRVSVHEGSHYVFRQVVAKNADLNASTPGKYHLSAEVAASDSHMGEFAEFGYAVEKRLYGGVFDFLEPLGRDKREAALNASRRLFDKLVNSDLPAAVLRGGFLLEPHERLALASLQLSDEKVKEAGTFGLLRGPADVRVI